MLTRVPRARALDPHPMLTQRTGKTQPPHISLNGDKENEPNGEFSNIKRQETRQNGRLTCQILGVLTTLSPKAPEPCLSVNRQTKQSAS